VQAILKPALLTRYGSVTPTILQAIEWLATGREPDGETIEDIDDLYWLVGNAGEFSVADEMLECLVGDSFTVAHSYLSDIEKRNMIAVLIKG